MKNIRQKEDILSSQSSSSKKLKKKKGSSKFFMEEDHDEEPATTHPPKKNLSGREKRRNKRGSASGQPPPDITSPSPLPSSDNMLPLSSFTSKLLSIYPVLEHLTYTLSEHWEDEPSITNPLHQYLLLFFHSRIHELCTESVKSEYDKLIKARKPVVMMLRAKRSEDGFIDFWWTGSA